jgi:hypothetical protein
MSIFGSIGFKPLLHVGMHNLTVTQLRNLCVDKFSLSKTREAIMLGLEQVIEKLRLSKVSGELWVDGSFLTEKMNPNDSDVVLFVKSEFCDNATMEQREAMEWLVSNLKDSHYCDSYVSIEYPETHPLHSEGEWWKAYWIRQWGFSEEDNIMKGIAVISL